jgi:hypothetical protein
VRLADNDVPEHLEPAHRDIWHAACLLLAANSCATVKGSGTFKHGFSLTDFWEVDKKVTKGDTMAECKQCLDRRIT